MSSTGSGRDRWLIALTVLVPIAAAAIVMFGGVRGAVITAIGIVGCVVLVRRHAIRVAFETALILGTLTLTWTSLRIRLNLTPSDLLLAAAAMCGVAGWLAGQVRPTWARNLRPLATYSVLIVTGGLVGGLAGGGEATGGAGATANAARFACSMIGCALIAATMTNSSSLRRRVMLAWCAGGAMSASAGLVGTRIQGRSLGLADHPNHFGFSMLICVGVAAALTLDRTAPRWMRIVATSCGVLCAVGVAASGSRAALVGLFAGIASYLAIRYSRKPLALIVIGAAVLVAFAAFPQNIEFAPNSSMSRLINPNSGVEMSNQSRAARLDAAITEITDHPLSGSGFRESRQAHNIMLQLLATAGVFGLLALIAGGQFVVRSVRLAWRAKTRRAGPTVSALAGGLIAVVTTMMFSTNLWDRYLLLFLWLAGAWIDQLARSRRPVDDRSRRAAAESVAP